jgi:peptidyl-dipeptidase Dcp
MRALLISVLTFIAFMANAENPLFTEYNTVHGTIPFNAINNSHWEPAIDRGIELAHKEIEAITAQNAEPTFENTIVALENVGKDLDRVLNAFFPLLSANSDDEMMDISVRASQKLSDYSTSIVLNEALWKRVKTVYDNRDKFTLDNEDKMLLQQTYDSFALSGANLQGEAREKYKELSAELSALTTTFGQNVLRELNGCEFWLTANDIDGLPENTVTEAAEAAKAKGREGEYMFSFDQPVYMSFMKYSTRGDLREKFYKMYQSRNSKGEYSNVGNITRIAELRRQIANLLGNPNHATHALKRTMAEKPENVYNLLDRLRDAYQPAQKAEFEELTKFASNLEGHDIKINPWDYSYYSNKLKTAKYAFDDEELRPYFQLDSVITGVFGLATKLYGLKFTQNPDIQVYHPDVKAFDVTDENGKYVGVIYTDFFPRASKSPGAWMTNFKDQYVTADGENSRPQVTIVMNFTKPTADKPSLLTPYEVETFLHEFGHALHGLLANTKYKSLSGTSVYRDFVELPSQFNENYLTEKEFLDGFAHHYQTGEAIPEELVNRLIKSSQYGAAYSCMRQLMFGYLDMAWHTITEPVTDAVAFERNAVKDVNMFEPVEGTLISPTFSHIFSGSYAAGYYSYKWAEVLDADAFAHFKENGIFDRKTADEFRTNVLMKGGTENPAELYRRFRGQDPTIDALLIRDGIKDAPKVNVPNQKKN